MAGAFPRVPGIGHDIVKKIRRGLCLPIPCAFHMLPAGRLPWN